jgi:hypothetical protein
VRECKFGAMVELDRSARADAVRRLLDGTRPQCVLQSRDGKWFPAAVSVRGSPSKGRPVDAVVRVRLLAGEPEAFFAAGQAFTLWADAIVDDQIVRGEDFVGDGVIVNQEAAAGEDTTTRGRPAQTCRRTVPRPRLGTGGSLTAGLR